MEFNFLTMMAYLIVVITIVTMVFGIIAYSVYKMRESKRAQKKQIHNEEKQKNEAEKDKYLFFEQVEIVL